jgi:hypothetical protein
VDVADAAGACRICFSEVCRRAKRDYRFNAERFVGKEIQNSFIFALTASICPKIFSNTNKLKA